VRPLRVLLPALLLLTGCATWSQPEAAVTVVSEEPCADAEGFSCVTLAVPTDHVVVGSATWDVTFAVHRAEQESRGVFVTATGGPGSSGIALATDYTDAMPAEITDSFDVVFFDQRGIGLSQPFRCDDTVAADASPGVDSSSSPEERDAFAEAATAFGEDCFAEAGVDPADAARYGTRQAVEDLELFRRWLGADTLTLYGESYGTQFVQTYAAAHPEHVDGLVLDGVVDLSTEVEDFYTEAAQAYSDALTATLLACDVQRRCADEAPGDSLAGYDQLAEQLAAEPVDLGDGEEFGLDGLQAAAFSTVSDPYSRTALQEALNEGLDGEFESLATLAAPAPVDDTFSDALFLAVECQDFDFVPRDGSGRAELDDWLDAAAEVGADGMRLGAVFYNDLSCLFWPGVADTADFERPAPVTDPAYPMLVLTADTDPNTPTQNALRVYSRVLDDASLVTQQGGPHVLFGRGVSCVDDLVADFVAAGTPPPTEVTVCAGDVSDPY